MSFHSLEENAVHDSVKHYYGKDLQHTGDLRTKVNAVTRDNETPAHIREALGLVHDEVTHRYYGCGLAIPEALEGCSLLDLGSGSGRDCFAAGKLVGSKGRVVGIDMTEEQLELARKHVDYHKDKFGYSESNVDFVFGYIEKLIDADLKDNTFDIVISNCVINLSLDKKSVLQEAHRVLKEGGEMYFSDVYTDTYLAESIRKHRVLWGECVSGALHWQDLYQIAKQVGFSKPRLFSANMYDVTEFADLLGKAKFVSVTYRLFKLPAAKRAPCLATYNGGILGSSDQLKFDHDVIFKKNTALAIDGDLATILSSSRFASYFTCSDSGPVTPVTPDPEGDPFLKVDKNSKVACCCK